MRNKAIAEGVFLGFGLGFIGDSLLMWLIKSKLTKPDIVLSGFNEVAVIELIFGIILVSVSIMLEVYYRGQMTTKASNIPKRQ